MSQAIFEKLHELRLPGMKEIYEEEINRAGEENHSHEAFLFNLLEHECTLRRTHRIERRLKEAGLPQGKTFADFDLKRLPLPTRQKIKLLKDGEFLRRKENVLVFGNPGTGKTHLLTAMAYDLIEQDHRILFTTCSILVQQLLAAKQELKLPRLLKRFSKFDGIIIDDIGYVQQTREEMEVLFTLLANRYETGSIMLTSNLPFSKWDQIFKDPMTAAAAVDRLVHHSIIIEMNVDSYRSKAAQNKKNEKGE